MKKCLLLLLINLLPVMAFSKVEILSESNLTYQSNNKTQYYDLHYPKNISDKFWPVYIHIHGGGWVEGDKSQDSKFAKSIAAEGYIVINANYTLSNPKEVPYVSGFNDISALVKSVKKYITENNLLNADLSRITIGGSSAGSHLALMQATRSDLSFKCVVDLSGPTDLTGILSYGSDFQADLVEQVFGTSNLSKYSPVTKRLNTKSLFIGHAVKDSAVPYQQAKALESIARQLGLSVSTWYPTMTNPSPINPNHLITLDTALPKVISYLNAKCR